MPPLQQSARSSTTSCRRSVSCYPSVDKDALDVLRLLRAIPFDEMARGMRRLLASDLAVDVTRQAIEFADGLLGQPDDIGPRMAARARSAASRIPPSSQRHSAALYTDVANELS
jgi:hypothetical protein